MQTKSYNKEVRIATAQIIDALNGIVIERIDRNSNVQKKISVPCLYGNRSRELKSLENRGGNIKIPMMILSISSLSKDLKRVHSINEGLQFQTKITYDIRQNIAVPIDIKYEMLILTKYQEDLDQILSNFIINFNPGIYVVWNHPYNSEHIKSQVIWNNDLVIEFPAAIKDTDPYRFLATTTFTYRTWMFPGIGGNADDGPKILKFNFNENHTDGLDKWYDTKTLAISAYDDNIGLGFIDSENYDFLRVHFTELTGSYWLNVSGILDEFLAGDTWNDIVTPYVNLVSNWANLSGTYEALVTYDPQKYAQLSALTLHPEASARMIGRDLSLFNPISLENMKWNATWLSILSGSLSGDFAINGL